MRRIIRSKFAWGTAIAIIGVAAWAIRDYAKWRSLGPGGLPANVGGWLKMSRFRLQATNELDATPLHAVCGQEYGFQAWTDVRKRTGPRPKVSPYPIPHRQLNQLSDIAERENLKKLFDDKVLEQAAQVEYATSHYEKRSSAITLKDATNRVGGLSHGEIAHIHPTDSSMHMILSARDAIAAIEMGWAQRHGLAGIAVGLPATYVMVYAPRHKDDLKVIEELLNAAIAYALLPVTNIHEAQ